MKFKEYIKKLNNILNIHPETADLNVIYSSDDEGNSFNFVSDYITLGHYNGKYCGEFTSKNQIQEMIKEDIEDGYSNVEEEINSQFPINAICIN